MEDALQGWGTTQAPGAWLLLAGSLLLLVALLVLRVLLGRRGRRPDRRPQPGWQPGLELRWTTHVRERMEQRRISAAEVEETLRTPDRCEADPGQRSMRFEKDFDRRTVKVWVAADPWPPVREVVVKSAAALYAQSVRIRREQVGRVIGRGGATIRHLQTTTQARITVDRDGTVRIRAGEPEQVAAAVREVVRTARSR